MEKYLFLRRDSLKPQALKNTRLVVAQATKDIENNPMFTEAFWGNPQCKWEVRYDNGYPNVIYDPEYRKYRCYYTLFTKDDDSASTPKEKRAKKKYTPSHTRITSLAYAESDDGIHWCKPNLGLVDFEGSKDNNLLFRYAHGTGVFLDEEEKDPCKRYKLVTKVEYPGQRGFMAVNFSDDGIHWGQMRPWPRWNPPADSHNFPFRDKQDGLFKVITRTWRDGVRISCICSSQDFVNWSEPEEILRGDGYESQVYSMPVFWYDGVYLGLASMFHEGDQDDPNFDTVDLELTYSNKTDKFDRVAPKQYLISRGEGKYPTGEFDCGCIYAAAPIEIADKLCIYYMGGNGQHTNYRETSFGRAFIEKDRFAWYEQNDKTKDAILTSGGFNVYGNNVSVLADTLSGGDWSVAVCPAVNSVPFEGFGFEECVKSSGEDGYTQLHWSRNLMDLETSVIYFIIKFHAAKLYALKGDVAIHRR